MFLRAGLGQPFDYRNEFAKIQLMLLTAKKRVSNFSKNKNKVFLFLSESRDFGD